MGIEPLGAVPIDNLRKLDADNLLALVVGAAVNDHNLQRAIALVDHGTQAGREGLGGAIRRNDNGHGRAQRFVLGEVGASSGVASGFEIHHTRWYTVLVYSASVSLARVRHAKRFSARWRALAPISARRVG